MSRRDTHHQEVVHALQKDQWVVTDDPLTLDFAGKLVGIELGVTGIPGCHSQTAVGVSGQWMD